ncbi:MAG: BACON domain-containing protein [Bacteroidales bacterium]|nr:BACON domain-containing protein [Bacteroidales bacterium]
MKLATRFLTLLAFAAAVFTGCRPEERDIDLPQIQVGGSDLHFDTETKKASVALDKDLTTLTLSVTANRDWTADIAWDSDEIPWIAVTPDHGEASDAPQRVVVTVLNNAGYNRNKQVKFSINYDYKTIAFAQLGERGEEIIGTLDNPLTVAGVVKYVKGLGADVQSSSGVYVKGKISRIDDNNNFASSGTYGNATFYISDDGTENGDQFYCYRVLYLGNKKWNSKTDTDIKVGDDVIIYGKVVNYKGNTPETVQGTAFIYEHNGVNRGTDEGGGGGGDEGTPTGTGTLADPYNVSAARAAVKNLTWTSNDTYEKTGTVYVKGKISRIADNGTFGQSGTFGNATFYINDDGADGAELYCYRILYLGNKKYTSGTDIKVGDEVIVCGELMNYRGNTPETVANAAYLYSLNGDTGGGVTPPGPGGDPAGSGTQADPYNVAAARNAVKDFTWTSNTDYQKTGTVYVKGKISRIADNGTFGQSGTFGNATFYISDDGKEGNELYCYRILYLGNVKYTSGTDIKVGDEVVICGELMNYRGNTPETVANAAYLYSLNESGGGGGGGDTGEVKAVSVAEFIAAPESDKQVYELVGTIGGTINTTYGNFDLADGTGTVYVYGLTATELGYGAKNDKSYASLGLVEGDKIKIRGYRGSFNDKIEVMYAWFIEKVSGGGGGDTPGGNGSGTLEDPYTPAGAINAVKDLTWTSNTDYQKTDKVYVKGKISKIANNGTYVGGGTFGNASYYISADGTENEEFYIFRSLYFNGEKYTSGTDIKVGDEVIVYGALMNYKGNTPETVANENWLYSLNGDTGSGGGGGGGDTPAGVKAVSVAQFIAAPESDSQVYELVGTIGGSINTTYGNFDLTDETGTVYVYGLTATELGYGAKNDKSYASLGLAEGDKIKIRGYRGSFNDKIEVMYAWFVEKVSGGGGGGDTPGGSSVSFATNSEAQTWAADTDGTYGGGFATTTQGLKIAYYKHTSSSNPVAPNANHIRVYKNSVLSISSTEGKKIKKIVMNCAPDAGSTSYCFDMTGLEGGASATADKGAKTVSWSGSASKVVLQANNGQVRVEKLTVEFE